ncbi:SH3 domain-containing protein [Lewinella sp. IMCC34183]|uniref:SH3 domain-containing protein n=1 Tax=Lewinella sp. IMCC34183 TaxID=2248762 RepID=UPI000E260B55|nr:SH3 domain-containing protein [Lewinella sp. IMCC34183]
MPHLAASCFPTLFVTLILLLCACGDDPAATEPTGPPAAAADSLATNVQPAPELAPGTVLTAWVDGLFLRAQPATGGTIVAQVPGGAELTYTGRQSDTTSTIVLRGIAFRQPWLEVRTVDNREGWVFGGATTAPGEQKDDGYRSNLEFTFPQFGSFDLTDWERQAPYEARAGKSVSEILIYQKDDRRLAVKTTEVPADKNYSRLYTLTTMGGKLLKTRAFRYEAKPGGSELTETVTDYTVNPQRTYTRRQRLSQPVGELNARPELAAGEWTTTEGAGSPR